MSNDWNLTKARLIRALGTEIVNGGDIYVKYSDVQRIRKELIKDIEEFCKDSHYDLLQGEIFDIINKRFGVKE